ncbi:MAG TPA: hypothetical protein VH459_00175 [Gaiellales bacterium]|jgi:hypothetical protein
MTLSPDELRRLVRRDIAVAGGGSAIAIFALAMLAAGALGIISQLTADRLTVAAAALVVAASLAAWVAGPRELRKQRYIVFVPVCLVALPGLLALADLGAGIAVITLSGAVGFGAAIALGLAIGGRRR